MKKPLCTKPWTRLYVTTDGNCWNCCFQVKPFYIVKKDSPPFEEVWNNTNIQRIRDALLKGEMPSEFCDCLNKRGSIPPDDVMPEKNFIEPVRHTNLVQITVPKTDPRDKFINRVEMPDLVHYTQVHEKSLLIVGVARSASTLLQSVCSKSLDFTNAYEIFNSVNVKRGFASDLPFFAPEKYYLGMWNLLVRYDHHHTVKDVLQPDFILSRFDDIMERFNVLYIRRDVGEVIYCHRRRGWGHPRVRSTYELYDKLFYFPREGTAVLSYEDFITDTCVLYEILKKWYPFAKHERYIDDDFVLKREDTRRKLLDRLRVEKDDTSAFGEQMDAAEQVMQEDRDALKKLAE